MKLFLAAILFCFQSLVTYSQKADIKGLWYFDRFGGPHGEIAKSPGIIEANKMNKGMTITFTNDGKAIRKPPGGNAGDNSVVNYQVFYDRKEVILDGETLQIMLLTSEILELYNKDGTKAALFLKRSKDGRTSMSAP